MHQNFQVLIEWSPSDNVWVTYVPTLNYLSTYGDSREEALDYTREAILGYMEAAAKEGIEIPSDTGQAELVNLEVITV
jgi:predicted RNase H-like HicB family nuclease